MKNVPHYKLIMFFYNKKLKLTKKKKVDNVEYFEPEYISNYFEGLSMIVPS